MPPSRATCGDGSRDYEVHVTGAITSGESDDRLVLDDPVCPDPSCTFRRTTS